MPQVIMSSAEWLKKTDGGMLKPRSKELKAVDDALKKYEMTRDARYIGPLRFALTAWIQKEGGAWKNSIRNKNKAVEILRLQVTGDGTPAPGMKEAIEAVREDAKNRTTQLFAGKKLEFRAGYLGKVEAMTSNAKTLGSTKATKVVQGATAASVAMSTKTLADALMGKLVPDKAILAQVMLEVAKVMPGFSTELAKSLIPFIGVMTSGVNTVISGALTLKAELTLRDQREHSEQNLSVGDPGQAMLSLIKLLERARDNALKGFGIGLAEFGTKLTGALVGDGVVINAAAGMAAAVARLSLIVLAIKQDVEERNAGNDLMKEKIVDSRLFQVCPIMGAYMIVCAPASDLVNSLFNNDLFYRPEAGIILQHAFKTHIEPLREAARGLVKAHRLHIPDLEKFAFSQKTFVAEGKVNLNMPQITHTSLS